MAIDSEERGEDEQGQKYQLTFYFFYLLHNNFQTFDFNLFGNILLVKNTSQISCSSTFKIVFIINRRDVMLTKLGLHSYRIKAIYVLKFS